MKNWLFAFSFALLSSAAIGQTTLLDSVVLGGLPLQIYVQSHTGTPIVAQQYSYVGLDKASGDSLWSVQRSGLAGIAQKMSEDYDENEDFRDIPQTPFVYVSGQLIDVRKGSVLIPETDEIKSLRDFRLYQDKNLLLLELGGKGVVKLYGLDTETGKTRFKADLQDASGLTQLIATDQGLEGSSVKPMFLSKDRLLYNSGKHLSYIDLAGGKTLWTEKMDPGAVYFPEGTDKLLVFEEMGGLGLGSLSNDSGLGKVMYLLDLETGKQHWKKGQKLDGNVRFYQPFDGGLLIAYDGGLNIYDYTADSEGRWKKGFRQGGIKKVEETDEGLMVYFRNKRMLLDPANGEEKWKKEEKLDREPDVESTTEYQKFDFAGKEAYFKNYYQLIVGDQTISFGRIALDAANNRIVTAKTINEKADLKKEIYAYKITLHDLSTGESLDVETTVRYGIDRLEFTPDGDVVAYNDQAVQFFSAGGGAFRRTEAIGYQKLQRKGGKAARNLGKLLGGGDDQPESVPPSVQSDYRLRAAMGRDDFNPLTVGRMNVPYAPLLGYKSDRNFRGIPFLTLVDKKNGEVAAEEIVLYDNTNFTVDQASGKIYVIHGNAVRWYAWK